MREQVLGCPMRREVQALDYVREIRRWVAAKSWREAFGSLPGADIRGPHILGMRHFGQYERHGKQSEFA